MHKREHEHRRVHLHLHLRGVNCRTPGAVHRTPTFARGARRWHGLRGKRPRVRARSHRCKARPTWWPGRRRPVASTGRCCPPARSSNRWPRRARRTGRSRSPLRSLAGSDTPGGCSAGRGARCTRSLAQRTARSGQLERPPLDEGSTFERRTAPPSSAREGKPDRGARQRFTLRPRGSPSTARHTWLGGRARGATSEELADLQMHTTHALPKAVCRNNCRPQAGGS